jgi:hypothetical protein
MRPFLATLALASLLPLAGLAADTTAAYDLLFRNGTLDDVDRGATLVYDREVENGRGPDTAIRDTGRVNLDFQKVENRPETAVVTFRQGEKFKTLGEFPASVGNPMIMLFYEFTVRDMAEAVGGSPFYIRNRVKDSLTRDAPIETGTAVLDGEEIEVRRVTLRPFEDDPNAAQMGGFDELALTVTMSEAVPGWYHSLVAEVPGEDGPLYRSAVTFEGTEDAR